MCVTKVKIHFVFWGKITGQFAKSFDV